MSDKRWVANATAIADLWTVSLSGTVSSKNYTMTINGKSIVYSAGSGDTVNTILTGLVTLWNSLAPAAPAEFQELTPAALPVGGPFTSMTLTGKTLGKPSTIGVSTSGAATFTIANTTPATGPNDFANGANWSGGVAPANGDTLVFDAGTVNCKYGLNTSLTGITVVVLTGFTAQIGLPLTNNDSPQNSYNEYRPTALTLAGGTAQINGPSMTRCNLAFGANLANVQITATGNRPDRYTPTVLITGGNGSSILAITKGDVGVAFYLGQTANFPTILTSYQNSATSDVVLFLGAGCTLGSITKNGGALTVNSNVTTLLQGTGGGTVTVASGAVTTMTVEAGTAIWNSVGTLGTVTVSGKGTLDFGQDPNGKTITNPIQIYGDSSSVMDPAKVVNAGILSVTTYQTTALNVSHGSGNVCSFT